MNKKTAVVVSGAVVVVVGMYLWATYAAPFLMGVFHVTH
jgi:hypothetical protein